MPSLLLAAALAAFASPAPALAALPSDLEPNRCADCAEWNRPQPPFRLHGTSWYVGTAGLSAVLVDSGEGLVLLDGGLPQSAPRIAEAIRALGFRIEDVRWILNSHAHFDHAGGIAALQRLSGARVAASPEGAEVLRRGLPGADDPQHGLGEVMRFPPVREVRALADGETLRLGTLVITRHATPGHTPGGSSYSWRSCEAGACLSLVYADSLSPVSAEGFRFGDTDAGAALAASIARIEALDCDLLVTTHPAASGLLDRGSAAAGAPGGQSLVDPAACRDYARRSRAWLERRLAQESAGR